MRRYFFDIDDGLTVDLDMEGMELENIESVKETAARTLVDMVEITGTRSADRQLKVIVRDEKGVIGQITTAGLGERLTELVRKLKTKLS